MRASASVNIVDFLCLPENLSILIRFIDAYIPAGFPSPGADFAEEEIDLIREFGLDRPSVFVMRLNGNSMEGSRNDIFIPAGSIVTVDRSRKAKPGNLVVVSLNGKFILKILSRISGRYILTSSNPSYPAIEVGQEDELIFFGVVDLVIWKANTKPS